MQISQFYTKSAIDREIDTVDPVAQERLQESFFAPRVRTTRLITVWVAQRVYVHGWMTFQGTQRQTWDDFFSRVAEPFS